MQQIKMKKAINKRRIASFARHDPGTLIQFGTYIFPINDIARIEDKVKKLYDHESDQQIGWTFSVVLKNGDILLWEIDERDYDDQEALMDYYTQSKQYAEALRIATIQLVWGSDVTIVRPKDTIHDDSV
jgi:sensor histidine kinase regulating citrate/malate metabolism